MSIERGTCSCVWLPSLFRLGKHYWKQVCTWAYVCVSCVCVLLRMNLSFNHHHHKHIQHMFLAGCTVYLSIYFIRHPLFHWKISYTMCVCVCVDMHCGAVTLRGNESGSLGHNFCNINTTYTDMYWWLPGKQWPLKTGSMANSCLQTLWERKQIKP